MLMFTYLFYMTKKKDALIEKERLITLKKSDVEKRWNRDRMSSSEKNIIDSARDR